MSRLPLLPGRSRPLLFAHRGCSSLAPENTMAAFKKARELGSPGIELDIHAAATGELVVAHDDTFKRTAPDHPLSLRHIETLSLEEIRGIDVGSFFDPAFHDQRPPLLEEVLEEFCPGMYIDIELKSRKTRDDPLPALTAKLLARMGKKIEASVTVSSFNPLCLGAFKNAVMASVPAAIPTAVIWSADTEVPWALRYGAGRFIARCDYVKPVHLQAGPWSRFRLAGLEGRPLVPWTVDDPALAERLIREGCAGIVSNRPQDMAALLGRGS